MKKMNAVLLLIATLALSLSLSLPASASPRDRSGDSMLGRLLQRLTQVIHTLEGPMIPPPGHG